MSEIVDALLRTILVVVGALSAPDTTGIAVAAVAVATICLIAALRSGLPLAPSGVSLARPRGAIPPSVLVAQSDPDARGHARPRAPGHAAAAA